MRHHKPPTDNAPAWTPDKRELLAGVRAWWEWNLQDGHAGVLVGLHADSTLLWIEGLELRADGILVAMSRGDRQSVADFLTTRTPSRQVDDAIRDEVLAAVLPLAALARSESADPRVRHQAALELASYADEAVARRLIELLYDDAVIEELGIAAAAGRSLAAMPVVALPHVLAELPIASASAAQAMLQVLRRYPPDQLAALPDATRARMAEWLARHDVPGVP